VVECKLYVSVHSLYMSKILAYIVYYCKVASIYCAILWLGVVVKLHCLVATFLSGFANSQHSNCDKVGGVA
jgi:hypothetical protein